MDRKGCLWFIFLSLSFLTTSGVKKTLKILEDLQDNNIEFGKKFPRHGLKLLFWLSRNVEIDQNDVINLRDIDPSRGDFGFHRFYNRENVFPSDGNNFHYYSLGNANPYSVIDNNGQTVRQLPSDITEDYFNTRNTQRWDTVTRQDANRDRIVVQFNRFDLRRGRRLYITQHPRGGNTYDGQHTYEISSQLLRDIQDISTQEEFLRCVHYDFNSNNNVYQQIFHCNPQFRRFRREALCDTRESLKLAVLPDDDAKARITWRGIPKTILKSSLSLKLYANMNSSMELESYKVGEQQSGSRGTLVPLDPGLQLRLVESALYTPDNQIWVSPEFDEANGKLPTNVLGYAASLQLFVKKGKACARLYIHKSFTNWATTFKESWVGFYKSSDDEHNNYETWQWAVNFNENRERHTDTHLAYEYQFGSDVHHDVQARFFLRKGYSSVTAHTLTWSDEVIKKMVNVTGYDAIVQLFAKGNLACVRLYIKNTFTDWKNDFANAWVAFYNHADDGHSSYKNYQWVSYLKENTNKHTEISKAYEYKSDLKIQRGVQVRFFLHKSYSSVLAHTLPWGDETIKKIENNVRNYGASLQLIAN